MVTPRLLEHLPDGGGAYGFAEILRTPGEAPLTDAGLIAAAYKEDGITLKDHHADPHKRP